MGKNKTSAPKKKRSLPPLVKLIFSKQLHQTEEQRNLQIDMLRYRNNTLATTLGYIALLAQIIAFCTIYSSVSISASNPVTVFGVTDHGLWNGVDIFVNIVFMLFVFLTISRMKVYDKIYGFISIGIGAIEVVRLFLYPLALWNANASDRTVISTPVFIIQIVSYIIAAVFLIAAGITTVLLSNTLEKYLNQIKLQEAGK